RLQNGLATLPDVLEARSAAAQADYDLQAALGATQIAYGDLSTALGVSPTNQILVESIRNIKMPDSIDDSVEASIDKALSLRPDLMQQLSELRAARAAVEAERRSYFPTLSFNGSAAVSRSFGAQIYLPGIYSATRGAWFATLTLSWTL